MTTSTDIAAYLALVINYHSEFTRAIPTVHDILHLAAHEYCLPASRPDRVSWKLQHASNAATPGHPRFLRVDHYWLIHC